MEPIHTTGGRTESYAGDSTWTDYTVATDIQLSPLIRCGTAARDSDRYLDASTTKLSPLRDGSALQRNMHDNSF